MNGEWYSVISLILIHGAPSIVAIFVQDNLLSFLFPPRWRIWERKFSRPSFNAKFFIQDVET